MNSFLRRMVENVRRSAMATAGRLPQDLLALFASRGRPVLRCCSHGRGRDRRKAEAMDDDSSICFSSSRLYRRQEAHGQW